MPRICWNMSYSCSFGMMSSLLRLCCILPGRLLSSSPVGETILSGHTTFLLLNGPKKNKLMKRERERQIFLSILPCPIREVPAGGGVGPKSKVSIPSCHSKLFFVPSNTFASLPNHFLRYCSNFLSQNMGGVSVLSTPLPSFWQHILCHCLWHSSQLPIMFLHISLHPLYHLTLYYFCRLRQPELHKNFLIFYYPFSSFLIHWTDKLTALSLDWSGSIHFQISLQCISAGSNYITPPAFLHFHMLVSPFQENWKMSRLGGAKGREY